MREGEEALCNVAFDKQTVKKAVSLTDQRKEKGGVYRERERMEGRTGVGGVKEVGELPSKLSSAPLPPSLPPSQSALSPYPAPLPPSLPPSLLFFFFCFSVMRHAFLRGLFHFWGFTYLIDGEFNFRGQRRTCVPTYKQSNSSFVFFGSGVDRVKTTTTTTRFDSRGTTYNSKERQNAKDLYKKICSEGRRLNSQSNCFCWELLLVRAAAPFFKFSRLDASK